MKLNKKVLSILHTNLDRFDDTQGVWIERFNSINRTCEEDAYNKFVYVYYFDRMCSLTENRNKTPKNIYIATPTPHPELYSVWTLFS